MEGELGTLNQITDEHGLFRFDELRPGRWTLRVIDKAPQNFAYERDTLDFEVQTGEREKVLFKLLPRIREIKLLDKGTLILTDIEREQPVRVTPDVLESDILSKNKGGNPFYSVQIASCLFENNALSIMRRLKQEFPGIYIIVITIKKDTYHVVRIGSENIQGAETIYYRLKEKGYKPLVFHSGEAYTPDYKKKDPGADLEISNSHSSGNGYNGSFIKKEEIHFSETPNSINTVQVASCLKRESAEIIARALQKRYRNVGIDELKAGEKKFYVVRIATGTWADAQAMSQSLKDIGYNPLVIQKGSRMEEIKRVEETSAAAAISIQVASCLKQESAETIRKKLGTAYGNISITSTKTSKGTYYVVQLSAGDLLTAQNISNELKERGFSPLIKKTSP